MQYDLEIFGSFISWTKEYGNFMKMKNKEKINDKSTRVKVKYYTIG